MADLCWWLAGCGGAGCVGCGGCGSGAWLYGMRYGWKWCALSQMVPSVVKDRGGVVVVFGSFPQALNEHVVADSVVCRRVSSETVCGGVQCVGEQSHGRETICVPDVGVAE